MRQCDQGKRQNSWFTLARFIKYKSRMYIAVSCIRVPYSMDYPIKR
jgi:hypothetical protein